MGIFAKREVQATTEIGATEAIRLRVWSRWKKANLSRIAEDHKISISSLEAFATGKGSLPEADLHKLTKEFYHKNVRFDPAADRLFDTQVTTVAAPIGPPPFVNPDPAIAQTQAAYFAAVAAATPPVRPAPFLPGNGTQQPAVPVKRPGFM